MAGRMRMARNLDFMAAVVFPGRFLVPWRHVAWCNALRPAARARALSDNALPGYWGNGGRPLVLVRSAVSGVAVARCAVVVNVTATT